MTTIEAAIAKVPLPFSAMTPQGVRQCQAYARTRMKRND
jgi:hypothetical protein